MLESGKSKDKIFTETGMTIGVQDASFEIYEGEIFVIMGLSGSGKSTLIRHLNRLIDPTAGEIFIDGENVMSFNPDQLIDFRRHKMSMVFQRFGLFPHKTVMQNVGYGLEMQGKAEEARDKIAMEKIEAVGLNGFENQFPNQLSGGMQQRVGLARALATNSDIMLMDEAFSALDPLIRSDMQKQLIDLQSELKKTIVFITHDLDEAIRIGDRIAIMQNGEIAQIGTPEEIINEPANNYVKSFFKGVDVTSVLTASHILKKIHSTIVNKESTGIKSAIQYIGDFDEDYAYFIEKSGKYLGILTIVSLKEQRDLGGSIHDAIINEKPILENYK